MIDKMKAFVKDKFDAYFWYFIAFVAGVIVGGVGMAM